MLVAMQMAIARLCGGALFFVWVLVAYAGCLPSSAMTIY
jgi:hypothetical protein